MPSSTLPGPVGECGFESISRLEVPIGRCTKYTEIVKRLLRDLTHLAPGYALKVPLSELPDRAKNMRSALCRAARLKGFAVHTSSDSHFFYVWKAQ
jgi:hypothetical protein